MGSNSSANKSYRSSYSDSTSITKNYNTLNKYICNTSSSKEENTLSSNVNHYSRRKEAIDYFNSLRNLEEYSIENSHISSKLNNEIDLRKLSNNIIYQLCQSFFDKQLNTNLFTSIENIDKKESPPNNAQEKELKSTHNNSKTNLEQENYLNELNLLYAACEKELVGFQKNEEESISYYMIGDNTNSNLNSNFSTNLGTSYGSLKNNLKIKKVLDKNNNRTENKNKIKSIHPSIEFEENFLIEKNSNTTKCITNYHLKGNYSLNKN